MLQRPALPLTVPRTRLSSIKIGIGIEIGIGNVIVAIQDNGRRVLVTSPTTSTRRGATFTFKFHHRGGNVLHRNVGLVILLSDHDGRICIGAVVGRRMVPQRGQLAITTLDALVRIQKVLFLLEQRVPCAWLRQEKSDLEFICDIKVDVSASACL